MSEETALAADIATAVREALAAYAHDDSWSGWMQWMFAHGEQHANGGFTINADKVARWRHQMAMRYSELSEEEKQSDRDEADRILEIVGCAPARAALEAERDSALDRIHKLNNLLAAMQFGHELLLDDVRRAVALLPQEPGAALGVLVAALKAQERAP